MEKNQKNSKLNFLQLGALFFVLALGSLLVYLILCRDWPVAITIGMWGTICNLFGVIWIASGVFLFRIERFNLNVAKLDASENYISIKEILLSGSKVLPAGILYTVIGTIASLLSQALPIINP